MLQRCPYALRAVVNGPAVLFLLLAGGCASSPKTPDPGASTPGTINPALRDAAREELAAAMRSSVPALRAHAVEAARESLGSDAKAGILKAMGDESEVVRFAGAMAAGELRLADARDDLLRLLNDQSQHVRVGAIFGLHRLGDTRFSHGLEQALKDPDERIRANTCLALGRLGEPTAVRILRPMLKDLSRPVRIQAAESLWMLSDEAGLYALAAAVQSVDVGEQMVAVLALATPRRPQVRGQILSYLRAPERGLALVTARALGMLGYGDGFKLAMNAASSTDPQERFLAALALGSINNLQAQTVLWGLLKDTDAQVRLAAANAVLLLHERKAAAP